MSKMFYSFAFVLLLGIGVSLKIRVFQNKIFKIIFQNKIANLSYLAITAIKNELDFPNW